MAKHHTDQEILDVLVGAARPWGSTQSVFEPKELLQRQMGYTPVGALVKLHRLESAGTIILEDQAGIVGRPKIIRARIIREGI